MPASENSQARSWMPRWQPFGLSGEALSSMSLLFALGGLYILTSACMIAFNKYLIHEGRFPFAVPLVLLHAGFSSVFALFLLLVKPSLFPSLTAPGEKITVDRDLVLRGALPIALLFSAQLVLSNTAYLHSSMAFLQMMKESNLVLVYCFSLVAAMELFSWDKVKIICLILIATVMTISGEINFSWKGFTIQASGQLFESLKIVLQVMLLSSAGRKLDVLTYVLLVMPLCFCVLGSVFLMLVYAYPLETLKTPMWSDVVAWWPFLLGNACLAFVLNLSIALFMKHSSAVGFILAGIAKDALIVLAGVLAMHEPISAMQTVGFIAQLGFIWIWSLMKLFPDKFTDGVISGLVLLSSPAVEDKNLLTPAPIDYGAVETQGENGSNC